MQELEKQSKSNYTKLLNRYSTKGPKRTATVAIKQKKNGQPILWPYVR